MSPRSSHSTDFDFEFGKWTVAHRRLKERLANSDVWQEFGGHSETRSILDGDGNVEDNIVEFPASPYRAIALRSFDQATRHWAIWWLDARNPHHLDVPVIGEFRDGVGTFYADDHLGGRPIRVRFLWLRTDTPAPRWEQAFSPDAGQSWETNWTMDFTRA